MVRRIELGRSKATKPSVHKVPCSGAATHCTDWAWRPERTRLEVLQMKQDSKFFRAIHETVKLSSKRD